MIVLFMAKSAMSTVILTANIVAERSISNEWRRLRLGSIEVWACKVCGRKEEIDITKPVREISWKVLFVDDGYVHYCPGCIGEIEVECHNCGQRWKRKDLKWYPETEADEVGVYVVYVGCSPCCHEECAREFGYETDPEDPLRHEL